MSYLLTAFPSPHIVISAPHPHTSFSAVISLSTVSNVLSFVAAKTGYQNLDVPASEMPEFNLTGVVSGALTSALFTPFAAPNLKAKGASLNTKLILGTLPRP
ncbi:hypothetical protein B0H13DRAFT_2318065 [Mycena leptocephala]|nr:hypothetical protein B0H13DRAFT_2318065 [Mycena leptocephala]